MFKPLCDKKESVLTALASRGYWPAQAAKYLEEGAYSKAVEICRVNIPQEPRLLSARIIYAVALYHAGQIEMATSLFYHLLAEDPDNIVVLKYLGDIKHAENDVISAVSNYERILELDPECKSLKAEIESGNRKKTRTKTVTLTRPGEKTQVLKKNDSRRVYFYSETIGDLYLQQGYPGLAAEVYEKVFEKNGNPRLSQKLNDAREKMKEKEGKNVS